MIPDRPALTEDDVTDAMVAAGAAEFACHGQEDSADVAAYMIYLAMEKARVAGLVPDRVRNDLPRIQAIACLSSYRRG